MCTKERLLDLIENFVAFQDLPGGFVKLLARNHQYLGVNNALARMEELRDAPPEERGKLGVFWHTQGSGKTLSMLFFSQKVLRKMPGNWSFVIVTDREDLDEQAHKEFLWAGVVTEKHVRADRLGPPAPAARRGPPLRLHPDPEVPHRAGRGPPGRLRPR